MIARLFMNEFHYLMLLMNNVNHVVDRIMITGELLLPEEMEALLHVGDQHIKKTTLMGKWATERPIYPSPASANDSKLTCSEFTWTLICLFHYCLLYVLALNERT